VAGRLAAFPFPSSHGRPLVYLSISISSIDCERGRASKIMQTTFIMWERGRVLFEFPSPASPNAICSSRQMGLQQDSHPLLAQGQIRFQLALQITAATELKKMRYKCRSLTQEKISLISASSPTFAPPTLLVATKLMSGAHIDYSHSDI